MKKEDNKSSGIKNIYFIAIAVVLISAVAAIFFVNNKEKEIAGSQSKSEAGVNNNRSKKNEPLVGSEFALDKIGRAHV